MILLILHLGWANLYRATTPDTSDPTQQNFKMCVGLGGRLKDGVSLLCRFFSFKVSDLFLVSIQPQCCSSNVIIKLSCYLHITLCELFIVSQTTAISLNCLTVAKKGLCKAVHSGYIGSSFFFPTDLSWSCPKEHFKPWSWHSRSCIRGAHRPPARLWVWGALLQTSQRPRVPPTPWLLLSCATTPQYLVFSSGRLCGGVPHHCAGTAGFIKHLTSSRYLMVNLNQGAAGPHSRN